MTDGNGTTYGIYDEREMVVNWRRYRLRSQTNDTALKARVRKACVPLVNDTDQSDINNVPALEEALKSLIWYDAGDYKTANAAMREAIMALNAEYSRYETETELGSAKLDYAAGGGDIVNIL